MRWRIPILGAVWLLSACALQEDLEEREGAHPAGAVFRWRQRLDENGTIPPNALLNARSQREALLAAQAAGGGGAPGEDGLGQAPSWTWLGPGNIGGRIRAILIHPSQPDTMWVGSVSGGLWKTTDGGASWFPLDDFMASLTVGCMALDPFNPATLYAGSGEGFFNAVQGTSNTAAIQGAGVFRSTDGGATWSHLSSTAGADWHFVNRLAISPASGQVLLAATGAGIFRSTDGGLSWIQVLGGRILDLKFHPTDALKAVAGDAAGVAWHSADGGLTWQAASGISGGTRVELAYARSNPTTVYAAVSGSNDRIRIWRSLDGGLTYALRTSGTGITTYDLYNNALWVDPIDPNVLLFGGVYLYRSTDGGVTYSGINSALHPDHHLVVEHPDYNGSSNRVVFSGNDGGIHRALDILSGSVVWQELNNGLGITQFYGGALNTTSGIILGGTQDNGTLRYSGGTETWSSAFGGDGGFCAADPSDPNIFYGETQRLHIFRSTNGGVSGSYIYAGIQETLPNFIPPFILDPNEPNRMLAGGAGLWRSDNVKAPSPTWSLIKAPLNCPSGPQGFGPPGPLAPSHFDDNPPCNISTITVAEGESNLVWVGHNNGDLYRTLNGTVPSPTWTKMDDNGLGLPNRWISRIVVDPTDSNRVYVSLMGYSPDNLWRTSDGGISWTPISGSGLLSLPDIPVSALALHRTVPGWLYAGTDLGIFISLDDGGTWSVLNQGPANVAVEELVWKDVRDLLAVTHGRGMYLGRTFADCNENFIPDFQEIAAGTSQDCNQNGVPDACDISGGTSPDLNGNGVPDECEMAAVSSVGSGCGLVTNPVLAADPPAIGTTQGYTLAGAAPTAPVFLVLALGPPVATVLGPGCVAQVNLVPLPVVLTTGPTSASGGWSYGIDIPYDFSLVGLEVTAQAQILAPGGPLLGVFEISNGLALTVGF